ncbi:MAG TPA: hypothetical protein VFG01_08090 [Acidobacteriota bacterium]|nr:hypothetical protein [Acidobacteriota bacterium]
MNKRTLVLSFSILLTFISLSLLYFSFPYYSETQSQFDSYTIFFIDLNTLICPICLNSIEGVLSDLKMKNPDKVIGIVVCDKYAPPSEKYLRIINRQIKGFKIGFELSFPIYIDSNGHFSSFKENGVSLIELNNTNNRVIKKNLSQKSLDNKAFY